MSSSTVLNPNKKKRKDLDSLVSSDSDDNFGKGKKSYKELELEIVEKDKKISELEKMIEDLKKSSGGDNNTDDDISVGEELNMNDPWNSKYMQLREFRAVNGHCSVPCVKGNNLGQWLNNQKRAYKSLKENKKSGLTITRIALLEGLGIHWGKNYPAPKSWEENFEELKKYKAAMGHCNIHMDNKTPSNLAKWVSAQRFEHKRFGKGQDSLLSSEQIDKLNQIGFIWKGPRLV